MKNKGIRKCPYHPATKSTNLSVPVVRDLLSLPFQWIRFYLSLVDCLSSFLNYSRISFQKISLTPTSLSYSSLLILSHGMQMLHQRCYNICHIKNNTKFQKSQTFLDTISFPPALFLWSTLEQKSLKGTIQCGLSFLHLSLSLETTLIRFVS